MPFLLAASLFFAEPAPLEMPRAEAYLVHTDGRRRLEDRYRRGDLWESQTVDGRWTDAAGRVFLLAHLGALPPSVLSRDTTVTRCGFASSFVRPKRKDLAARHEAASCLTGLDLALEPAPIRQLPRGYAEVEYWEGTNRQAIVCTYRLERAETWSLAVWLLTGEDEREACREAFEERFLRQERKAFAAAHPPVAPVADDERARLRADARHAVAAYDDWHVTDATEFTVLDALPEGSGFVAALTNELAVMRARYAQVLPTGIDGTNTLSVARLYASRADYLEALAVDGITGLDWSAAYWSPSRRELVAYLPAGGERELLRTFRHEAFHQYLSYATAMLGVSPWLNEGYAQYFEAGPDGPDLVDSADLALLAELVPAVLTMDYETFYGGTDRDRALKYRLARAIAYFIEKGAPNVRFDPFKDLKRDYIEALFETGSMQEATAAAFRDEDRLKLFVDEWTKFWEGR